MWMVVVVKVTVFVSSLSYGVGSVELSKRSGRSGGTFCGPSVRFCSPGVERALLNASDDIRSDDLGPRRCAFLGCGNIWEHHAKLALVALDQFRIIHRQDYNLGRGFAHTAPLFERVPQWISLHYSDLLIKRKRLVSTGPC